MSLRPVPRGAGHIISCMITSQNVTRKIREIGHSLYLELWPNTGSTVVLFYPGSLSSPWQYRSFLRALHTAGLSVAALHLTGHGINCHAASFSFSDLLQDGLYAERWLRYEGYAPIVVCGHSQGGILTLAHASSSTTIDAAFPITGVLPQTAEAIKLTRFFPLIQQRQALERCIASLARLFPRLPIPIQAYLSMRKILAAAHETVCHRQRIRLTYPLIFLDSLFRAEVSPKLNCPLYFFSAPDDALFTPDIILRTYSRLEAPLRKLVWLPKGGHLAVMNPSISCFTAETIACACANMGLPLHRRKL